MKSHQEAEESLNDWRKATIRPGGDGQKRPHNKLPLAPLLVQRCVCALCYQPQISHVPLLISRKGFCRGPSWVHPLTRPCSHERNTKQLLGSRLREQSQSKERPAGAAAWGCSVHHLDATR